VILLGLVSVRSLQQPSRYNLLSNRLSVRFDNQLCRVNGVKRFLLSVVLTQRLLFFFAARRIVDGWKSPPSHPSKVSRIVSGCSHFCPNSWVSTGQNNLRGLPPCPYVIRAPVDVRSILCVGWTDAVSESNDGAPGPDDTFPAPPLFLVPPPPPLILTNGSANSYVWRLVSTQNS